VLGFGVKRRRWLIQHQHQRAFAHEAAGERQLLPLPEADVHAAGPARTQLRLEAGDQLRDNILCSRPIDSRRHRRRILKTHYITDAHRVAHPELKSGAAPHETAGDTRRSAGPKISSPSRCGPRSDSHGGPI